MQSVASQVLWLLVPTAAILMVLHAIDSWRRRRRASELLAGRESLSSATFGQRYFRNGEEEAHLAAWTRDALAQHLARELDGMHPDDLLWDDLHIDLEGDADLFWLLEERLEIHLIGEDAEGLLEVQRSIKTFRDLVEAVRQAQRASRGRDNRSLQPAGFAHT